MLTLLVVLLLPRLPIPRSLAPAPPLGRQEEAVASAASLSVGLAAAAASPTAAIAASLTIAIAASQPRTRPQFARERSASPSTVPKICHGREGHRVSRRRVR